MLKIKDSTVQCSPFFSGGLHRTGVAMTRQTMGAIDLIQAFRSDVFLMAGGTGICPRRIRFVKRVLRMALLAIGINARGHRFGIGQKFFKLVHCGIGFNRSVQPTDGSFLRG